MDAKRPFIEHVNELKSRVFILILFFLIGTVIGYFLYPTLLSLLLFPLHQPVFYTSPAGGFDFTLKISILFGFLFSLPMTMFQLLKFIEPLLSIRSKKQIFQYVLMSILLMSMGILFAYYVCLPASLHFLNTFSTREVKSLISTTEYLSFVTAYIVGFAFLFQLPLILLVINSLYRLSVRKLLSFQRYVIVISFIIGAILTPTPDPLNQTIMSAPIILLYYISIASLYVKNYYLQRK